MQFQEEAVDKDEDPPEFYTIENKVAGNKRFFIFLKSICSHSLLFFQDISHNPIEQISSGRIPVLNSESRRRKRQCQNSVDSIGYPFESSEIVKIEDSKCNA